MTVQRFPDLRNVQLLFWRLVSAPEGARRGAAELCGAGELESEDLSFLVRSHGRLGSVDRLEIYADMYFYRLRDCLAEDFPKVATWIGKARFHNLVTDYLLTHPSMHFSLRELGRALPDFLRTQPLAAEFPALPGLAQLEWARVDVFDDADAAPLSRQAILEGGASAPEKFTMALIPSARLLRVDASVLPLWSQLEDGDGAGQERERDRGQTRAVRVWRKGFSVFHRPLPADEERCLQILAAGGATLAQLGDLLLRQRPPDASAQQIAQRLAELLDLWGRDELLASHIACSSG